jgi:FkbM family methyltransferase
MNSHKGLQPQIGQSRLRRFLQKPWREKAGSIVFRWLRVFPGIPVPVPLPFGGVWLARNDFVSAQLFHGGFENVECSFVEHFLRPGMTVLDIGAHHGFYTLLASRKVGTQGKVIAVEASLRERKRLNRHLRINRCKNVTVESHALGELEGTAELYLVCGTETGCNSLRRPNVAEPTECVSVSVESLDCMLQEHKIERVDFIKMDVEGAELSVLKGANHLLNLCPRPVILVEVYDIRTQPWGYPARDIVRYLTSLDYRWYCPLSDGRIEEMDCDQLEYAGNFVAVPNEELASVRHIIVNPEHRAAASNAHRGSLAS